MNSRSRSTTRSRRRKRRALSKSGDDFVNVLKKGIDADIRRSMADFSVTGMAKDALSEAKKVAVEGLKSAPADFLPKLDIEATKESTKFHDWEDKAKDGGGWRTWRDLRAEEEEKRKEANGG